MNTGHEGSMTTVHANSTRDALRRIENMVSMSGLNYPVTAIRQQTASALDLLVQLGRMTGGKRRVLNISEVTGTEGEVICIQDIFAFRQTGVDDDGNARGHFEACGVRPQLIDRLRERGEQLPDELFRKRVLGGNRGKK